jgi:Na+/H+ antiporter NhaC
MKIFIQIFRSLLAIFFLYCGLSANTIAEEFVLTAPAVVHENTPFTITVEAQNVTPEIPKRSARIRTGQTTRSEFTITSERTEIENVTVEGSGNSILTAESEGVELANTSVRVIPGWMSILPPLIAIGLALWLRTVIPAIFTGLWVGVIVYYGFSFESVGKGLMAAFEVHVLNVLANRDHVAIILFSCMIGGLVGILSQNGGMQGVVNFVIRWANSPKRGQIAVWFLGMCVFFDDYTNTLVVGNSVRPVTDKLKISREKLAYIVDSTAAPVACIALITTWIGYQVGLIAEAVEKLEGVDQAAYSIFIYSIPYSFYPIFSIIFVLMVVVMQRDFGPMLSAEKRSYQTGKVAPTASSTNKATGGQINVVLPHDMPQRAINAVIPIFVLIASCIGGLYISGEGENLHEILSTANSYQALMWGSLSAVVCAVILTLAQGLLSVEKIVSAWTDGVNVMIAPLIILILAWALSDITELLGTADYLVKLGGEALTPQSIPAWAFVIAGLTAFATGSSWGVMAILLPLFVPLAWATMTHHGVAIDQIHILYSTVACILAGSVWGDHSSPISDTTVLSSLATQCDHIEHVRTQLPYALTVGIVSLCIGTIATSYGLSLWLAYPIGLVILYGILVFVGKPNLSNESEQG